jgi:C4-dicarboxylate transporter/malic acid transport protein
MTAHLERFGPDWFTASMGTGITAVGAFLVPGAPAWLKALATGLWLVNVGLFTALAGLFGGRLVLHRGALRRILHDPVQSMFLGAIPMALTTVVNGFLLMGPRLFGPTAIHIAFALWLANALVAVLPGILVPVAMFLRHDHTLSRMTGVWLMPIVPAEVAAASLAILTPHVHSLPAQRSLAVVGVGLWAFSVPLAFLLLGILFQRLALHRLPPRDKAISTWISLGTIGTGIMGMVGFGRLLPSLFGTVGGAMTGAADLVALVLWGFGFWWFTLSILLTAYQARGGLPFNLGWWGLTFPLGVFTVGTDLLAAVFRLPWMDDIAIGLYGLLATFFLLVATRTLLHLTGRGRNPTPIDLPDAAPATG